MQVKDILISAGFKINSETSSHYRTRPLHRDSDNLTCLSVSKKTGYWNDFVTSESGSLSKLIKLTTGGTIDFEPEIDHLDDFKKDIPIVFNQEEIKALLPSYGFYNKKGISNETLKLFRSGFCQGGKMYGRYVFPIISPDGSLVGLSGRTLFPKTDESWIKWRHLGKRNSWLYPLLWSKEAISTKKEVILVESIGNMLALWEAGYQHVLVCFGTSMSKALLAALIGLNPNRIILAMDNDPGANPGQKASDKIRVELEKFFDKSKICGKLTDKGMDIGDLWAKDGQQGIDSWYK